MLESILALEGRLEAAAVAACERRWSEDAVLPAHRSLAGARAVLTD
jgi:hypothetical protein